MRKLFPKQIWRRLRKEVLEAEKLRRKEEDAALPKSTLEEKHIRNLKVLVDRGVLLDLLPKHAVVAEVGVDRGVFTEQILLRTQPAKLHLVDTWGTDRFNDTLMQGVQEKFKDQFAAGTLQINRGLSTEVLPTFADAYFDWLYIDTDHRYSTTRDELALAENKVKPGGVIAGHDYILGNWGSGMRYGVIEAVREFCLKRDWEMIYQTCEARGRLSYALRKLS